MSATVLQGNVFDLLPALPRKHFDVVCASPPYWALRSYLSKDHPLKALELGSEKTPAEYVANMVRVLSLVRETMADHATLWLNVGDSYAQSGMGGNPEESPYRKQATNAGSLISGRKPANGLKPLDLCLIPWRLAIALCDDGWIVRSVVVWHKSAPMPASLSGWMWKRCRVKVAGQQRATHAQDVRDGLRRESNMNADFKAVWSDCPGCSKCEKNDGLVLRRGSWRCTSSWEPILMLAKTSSYYCDGIAVEQPAASATVSRNGYSRVLDDADEQFAVKHDHEFVGSTANLRDVWTIASENLKEAHYAAYPSELPRRCLKAGTSQQGYCPSCAAPWVRVVQDDEPANVRLVGRRDMGDNRNDTGRMGGDPVHKTLGWRASCTCPPHEPRAARVLDPFSGSGRTGIAVLQLSLDYTGLELNEQYVEMSRRLLRAESPLFA